MAFVNVGGEGGVKPTYFEVYAADKLVPSLRAAVVYSLSVFGQRRTWVQRLLDYEDEVIALVCLLLNRHSLLQLDASFAESLYGLRREGEVTQAARLAEAAATARRVALPGARPESPPPPARLTRGQYRAALLCEVLLPYLQSKADRLYSKHAPRQGGVLGLASRRAAVQQQVAQPPPGATTTQRALWHARRIALAAFVAAYPHCHAALGALRFGYQLGFLLEALPVHTPVLQLLGQRLVRVSGPELMQLENDKQSRRAAQLSAASAGRLGALRAGWLRGTHLVSDNVRPALILAVFGFKVLEWWYTSAEERLGANAALPPPPPPKAPPPAPGGVPLPPDPADCALCRRKRTNPAALAVSGYAFCYPCAFNWVSEHHCCPITHFPASLDHIRKLYEAM